LFTDAVDKIFAKVFLQEFVDARRRAIQNAPQVLFRSDPPLELQGLRGVGKTGEKGEVGFITFGMFRKSIHLFTYRLGASCHLGHSNANNNNF